MQSRHCCTRRDFLALAGIGALGLCLDGAFGSKAWAQLLQKGLIRSVPALHAESLQDGRVRCLLCPRLCLVAQGGRGYCRVRENRAGTLHSLVYGNPCAFHLDPMERIPFFHVLPGSRSLALATAGCNFACKFCQTWEISQAAPEDVFSFDLPPQDVVSMAKEMGAGSVAYTYVEPVIFYEYMHAVGTLARQSGLLSLIHSNGFIQPQPLEELCEVLDAANIALKSMDDGFYEQLTDGWLAPALDSLRALKKKNVHLEITNLIVPTRNDDMGSIREMCRWIKEELGAETPLHLWRFYPLYKLRNLPPTPMKTLEQARLTAMQAGLHYVYLGNVPGHEGENTFCPGCGNKIIARVGFMVTEVNLKGNSCAFCGRPIPGIWS